MFTKWVYRLLSHISAFICGAYLYGHLHGNKVELHRWVLTCLFGIIFLFSHYQIRRNHEELSKKLSKTYRKNKQPILF